MTSAHPQNHNNPLNPKGRFGRLSFAAWSFIAGFALFIVVILITVIETIINPSTESTSALYLPLIVIAYIIYIYFSLIFVIRRLHDRNQTGWFSILFLIPIINFFFHLYLLASKAKNDGNQFALEHITKPWEKVLGWIYIILIPIVFTLGVLAAIAIPAYQDYVQRAQNAQYQIEQQIQQQ